MGQWSWIRDFSIPADLDRHPTPYPQQHRLCFRAIHEMYISEGEPISYGTALQSPMNRKLSWNYNLPWNHIITWDHNLSWNYNLTWNHTITWKHNLSWNYNLTWNHCIRPQSPGIIIWHGITGSYGTTISHRTISQMEPQLQLDSQSHKHVWLYGTTIFGTTISLYRTTISPYGITIPLFATTISCLEPQYHRD